MLTIIILYVLGAIMLYRITGRDLVKDGEVLKALSKGERIVSGIFWPVILARVWRSTT